MFAILILSSIHVFGIFGYAAENPKIEIDDKVCNFDGVFIENDMIFVSADELAGELLLKTDYTGTVPLRQVAEENGYFISWDAKSKTAKIDTKYHWTTEEILNGRVLVSHSEDSKRIELGEWESPLKSTVHNSSVFLSSNDETVLIYAEELLCYSVGDLKTDAENLGFVAEPEQLEYNNITAVKVRIENKDEVKNLCQQLIWQPLTEERRKLYSNMNSFSRYVVRLTDDSLIAFTVVSDVEDYSFSPILKTLVSTGQKLQFTDGYVISDNFNYAYMSYKCEIVPENQLSSEHKFRMCFLYNTSCKYDNDLIDYQKSGETYKGWTIDNNLNAIYKKYPFQVNEKYAVAYCYYREKEQLNDFISLADDNFSKLADRLTELSKWYF